MSPRVTNTAALSCWSRSTPTTSTPGVGRLESADDYIASLRPLFEGAPDFYADNLYDIAMERHGWLTIGRTSGTLAEGGEFESVYVRLLVCRGDRLARIEHFELGHLDAARSRFEELRSA